MRRSTVFLTSLLILNLATTARAAKPCLVEFFASNNTATIDLQTAYQRLSGNEQYKLQESMIDVLQKKHVEQGKFEDILGIYQMSDNDSITVNNTNAFITSQCIDEQKVFSIAQKFANNMKQESVVVFISSPKPIIGEIKINFTTRKPSITELISLIHNRLPSFYSQAYSLHLTIEHTDFENAKVVEVEWLGSKINLNDINNAFPNDKVSFQDGAAYLIFKNGQKKQL